MSKILRIASAVAIAASTMAALVSTDATFAYEASNPAPVEISSVEISNSAMTYISGEIVQPLPAPAVEAETIITSNTAASLADLVSATAVPSDMSDEMRCLAGAVYFESKGETLAGQLAVAKVIIARSQSGRFPASYCGVVYQPSQFSFVRGGSMPGINTSSRGWSEAARIAEIAHHDRWDSAVEGALFFHAKRVSPKWRLQRIAQVDNHVFYR